MSEIILNASNLGKSYRIDHQTSNRGYKTLRESISARVAGLFSARTSKIKKISRTEEFWALKDVHFDIKRGEVVGIIGRNGAGKSTLLKILSRITEPTTGSIRIRGRVASLLEVGTGFHPELTGRENIFLNGAVLGMPRAEIKRKFDEIVAFAEVEKFLDTPVKRYSSGMYVRLAFAVAAHLEPEILIVDEVLAVGDAEFQKKCLGKMQSVSATQGRTVLFVSHNLAAVRQLCSTALLMERGRIVMKDEVNAVADRYLKSMLVPRQDQLRTNETGYTSVRVVNSKGEPVGIVAAEQRTFIEIRVRMNRGPRVQCGLTIFNQMDVPILLCASEYGGASLEPGENTFLIRVPTELLPSGTYRLEGAVWDSECVFHQDDYLCHFQVMPAESSELLGRHSSALLVSREKWIGVPTVPVMETNYPHANVVSQ